MGDHTGMLIIFTTIIGGFIQGASARGMLEVFIKTIFQLKKLYRGNYGDRRAGHGDGSQRDYLHTGAVDCRSTGSSYVFLAPVIGALGTFVTGSDTNSNILFAQAANHSCQQVTYRSPTGWRRPIPLALRGQNDFAAKHRHRGFCHQNGRSGQSDHVWHHEILLAYIVILA